MGTYLGVVVSENVQNSKKNEKARQRVNKLKLHIRKVEKYSGRGPGGVEAMKNVHGGRNVKVHLRV